MANVEDGRRAANISLVAGALGLTLVPLVGAVVAIIAGHLARRVLPAGGEGRRQAAVGLALGYLGLVAPVALMALGQGDVERRARLERACRAALDAHAPFRACSELIPDVVLSAAFRALDEAEPTRRRAGFLAALRASALCREALPPAACASEPSGPELVDGLVQAMRGVEPATKAALEAGLPPLLP